MSTFGLLFVLLFKILLCDCGRVGWHHLLDGYEFEQALEIGDG